MKCIWKTLVMGLLVAVAGRAAQAGDYSAQPLSTGSQPPAPGPGYDLLLAQNTAGPATWNGNSVPAESWTTDLQLGDGDGNPSHGITGTVQTVTGIFSGSGSTGVYPSTIGSGKHTEYTKGDIKSHGYVTGTGVIYQYVFHVTTYNASGGTRMVSDKAQGYHACP